MPDYGKSFDEMIAEAEAEFTEYFVKNYPGPDTIITDPKWHAPKLFSAAKISIERAALRFIVERALKMKALT